MSKFTRDIVFLIGAYLFTFAVCAIVVLLNGCGSPMIEPGKYQVDLQSVRDDMGFDKPGEWAKVEWKITESDGHYVLYNKSNEGLKADGQEYGDHVHFHQKQVFENREDLATVDLDLYPLSGTTYDFCGKARSMIFFKGHEVVIDALAFGAHGSSSGGPLEPEKLPSECLEGLQQ